VIVEGATAPAGTKKVSAFNGQIAESKSEEMQMGAPIGVKCSLTGGGAIVAAELSGGAAA
jgi:hypothetical protein